MFLFAESGEHHAPIIVEAINRYLGEPVYEIQMATTHVWWTKFFAYFGTTPEEVFGVQYSPETAIPWYTIMFVIACVLSVIVIRILRDKLSDDDPSNAQMTLEAGYIYLVDLASSVIGPHAAKYF